MNEGATSLFSRMRDRKLVQIVALYLGVALAGDTTAAIESYRELLAGGWEQAVADIPLLSDAPARLEALGGR